MLIKFINIVILLLFSLIVKAETQPYVLKESPYNLRAGIGILVCTNIRKNNEAFLQKNDPVIAPLPYLRFKLSKVEIASDRARFIFTQSLFLEIDTRVDYRGHNYEALGMSDRRKSIFGGVAIRFLIFKLEWLKDVLNQSKGDTLAAMLVFPLIYTPGITIMAQAEIEYWSQHYVDYYFGVRPEEITTNRSAYIGKEATSNRYQLTSMIKLTKKLILRNNLSYRKYGPNIYNSPTVKTSREYEAVLGLVYEFL